MFKPVKNAVRTPVLIWFLTDSMSLEISPTESKICFKDFKVIAS